MVKAIGGFSEYQYPNLRRLEIDMDMPRSLPRSLLFMNLTTQTPMLIDLTLTDVRIPWTFWGMLSTHRHLKHLSLAALDIKANSASGLWKTCMRLESLQMNNVLIEEGGRPKDMVFGQLRQLNISEGRGVTTSSYPLDVVLRSPMLESLELKVDFDERFRGSTKTGNWAHLKKLHVSCYYTNAVFSLFNMINGLGATQEVQEAFRPGWDAQAFKGIFGSSFDTLVDVDLYWMRIGNTTVPEILCLCPRLERLKTKYVLARHVAERGPWVCQQLRELWVQFLFEVPGDDLKRLIFERLSTLVRLERLTLDYRASDSILNYYSLECRLCSGFGRLASLKQLTFLWFYTSEKVQSGNWKNPDLGMEEAQWIVFNWKRLKMVKGEPTKVRVWRAQLWNVFQSRGVAVEL